MRSVRTFLSVLTVLVLAASGSGAGQSLGAAPPASDASELPDDLVAIPFGGSRQGVRVVDMNEGSDEVWETGSPGRAPDILVGDGFLFLAAGPVDSSATDVFAMSLDSTTLEPLGHVEGYARPERVDASGGRLLLTTFANWLPTGLTSLPIPERLRGTAATGSTGSPTADEVAWYGLDGDKRLWLAKLHEGEDPAWTDLGEIENPAYYSLLAAPDQQSLYIVDYGRQHILVVDAERGGIIRTVVFGSERFKRPPCAAAPSPDGDRLYFLSNRGNTADGVLVYDTRSWQQIGRYPPTHNYTCLAIAPDGEHLYASSSDTLIAIDTETGDVEQVVDLGADCCLWPILAFTRP